MRYTKMLHGVLPAVIAVAGMSLAGAAGAQSVAEFYQGKSLRIIVGYSPGSGFDQYARTLGRHIGKHVPGNPSVVVQNMPGAGSLRAANYIFNKAPRDGTLFGIFHSTAAFEPLLVGRAGRYDGRKFTWIGSMNSEVGVAVSWHTTGVRTIEDVVRKPLLLGGTGGNSGDVVYPLVLNNMIGTQFKLVIGYPGGTEATFAMERREVDGRGSWSWASIKRGYQSWIDDKKINVLVQMSTRRHPDLPNVPTVMDLARNDTDRKIMEIIFGSQMMGRPFAAPPGVPADRKAALRKAFEATLKDPAFIAEANKRKLELIPMTGAEMEIFVKRVYDTPPALIAKAKAVFDVRGSSQPKVKPRLVTGVIDRVAGKGRRMKVMMKDSAGKSFTFKLSGRSTRIKIAGKKKRGGALAKGMRCEFGYLANGGTAMSVTCP